VLVEHIGQQHFLGRWLPVRLDGPPESPPAMLS